MTQQVYTLGYSGKKMHEIETLVKQVSGILFDIRFSPRSRAPVWNGSNFRQVFGARYKHIAAFGNKNYRSGPISIVDFDAGVEQIERSGRPVILLCACKDYETCHRKTIADRLRALGFTVTEMETPEQSRKRNAPRQLPLA